VNKARNVSITPAQLRAARGALNWSQEDLAEAAKIARRTVAAAELGERPRMREGTLLKLRGALADAGVIFTRDGGVRLAPRKGRADDGDGERGALGASSYGPAAAAR
jgi:transcriptional regulator with XRE-family HTH domain